MKKEIKYVGFFDFQDSKVKRKFVTAAANKMQSICDILNECGYDVKIVSPSSVDKDKLSFFCGETTSKGEGLKLKTFFSCGGNAKPIRVLRTLWHLAALFVYLVLNTRKDEPVLVYHSLGYFNVINWAKRIRHFKMILEVEEIYQDVSKPVYSAMTSAEFKMIDNADAYIFPTELLNAKLNVKHKPYSIIYGTYNVEDKIVEKFDDGKIHVVYAGTFDPRKGGAAAAAAAAAHLPENYHIHICGFGSKEDERMIRKIIADTAAVSKATITFEGLKLGIDYIKFIQSCHIGLSTQDPSAAFNATSFPSKILSYMANGLSVVSIDIEAIRSATIGKCLTYYTEQTPQKIAEAIQTAPLDNDNRRVIAALREDFKKQMPNVLKQC